MVMKPVTNHAPISSAGEFTSRLISADTIKIPEPIIDPITSMVALVRPRALTSSLSWWEWMSQSLAGVGVDALVWVLTSLLQGGATGVRARRVTVYAQKICGHFTPEC